MLITSVVLTGLIYNHLVSDEDSTYSHDGRSKIPLGSSYYVAYPATQLVFFSSIPSILAPLLFSPVMALFSYFTAYLMTEEPDKMDVARLPSPFQLVLLIKTLEAKIMSFMVDLAVCFWIKKKERRRGPRSPQSCRYAAQYGDSSVSEIGVR